MMTMNIEDACLGGNEVGEAPGSLLDGGLRAFKHALQPGAVGGPALLLTHRICSRQRK